VGLTPTCPRCGGATRPPGLWSDDWTCADHGGVAPLHPPVVASDDALRHTAGRSSVPVWVPYPLPPGWLVTGVRSAGGERTGPVATVVACSGPHPLPTAIWDGEQAFRTAELLLVAEEPGVGLGAHLSGLPTIDPGAAIAAGAPALKMRADRHDVPLWWVGAADDGWELAGETWDTAWAELENPAGVRAPSTSDVSRFVGEAAGVWLWVLVWPADAAAVLMERFRLVDYRGAEHGLVLAFGALSPRI